MAARIAQHPLEKRLRPGRYAEGSQRSQFCLRGSAAHQRSLSEGPHNHHADAKVGGKGQYLALYFALQGVIGYLDGRYAPRLHDLTQFTKGRTAVVPGTNSTDLPSLLQLLQQSQVLTPVYQVMDLIEINAIGEERQGALHLCLTLRSRRGPDLRG